jgi:membrane protease YdiL (CAAX protease family)
VNAVQEVFLLWGISFAGMVAGTLFLPQGGAAIIALVSFLYLPLIFMRRRGEDYSDYGLNFRNWRADLKLFALASLIGAPLYLAAYAGFASVLPKLPEWLAKTISPYAGYRGLVEFHLRFPHRFAEWIVTQLLVVALPEEFFYRGYLQKRLRDAWPQGRFFLGARLGPAFFVTTALFALGHLAIFQAWRLEVFIPGLVFAWMRERTGTIVSATLFHAACNLYELILAASFFGRL